MSHDLIMRPNGRRPIEYLRQRRFPTEPAQTTSDNALKIPGTDGDFGV